MKMPRQRSIGYEAFGFTLAKQNGKYVAVCRICDRALHNTAFIRLKGHRNICKPPATDNAPLCSMFVPNDERNDRPSVNDDSQIPTDSFKSSLNELSSFRSSNEVSQKHDTKNKLDQKKVTVLELIKENKYNLFESTISDKIDGWLKVLRKAQELGLASKDKHWTFARDSLYEMWKNRTLAKKDCLESGGWNDKLDIVDLKILQILKKTPSRSNTVDLSDIKTNCSVEQNPQNEEILESIPISEGNDVADHHSKILKRKTMSTETSDEMHESELKIKKLKCEILKLEMYKHRLQILQLERELKLPPSEYTASFFPESQINRSKDNIEHAKEEHIEMAIKIEDKDSDE